MLDYSSTHGTKHEGCKRQFTHLSKTWYAESVLRVVDCIDQVTVGFYYPEGGTTGEFQITWVDIGREVVPRLESFDDAWDALFCFSDMLEAMAKVDDENITPDEFCKMLISLGIEDRTPTENV